MFSTIKEFYDHVKCEFRLDIHKINDLALYPLPNAFYMIDMLKTFSIQIRV